MNYEQKYKEALEKLKAFHRDYKNISHLVDVKEELESIFPELKESEDERIRKELIERFIWELKGAEEQDAAGCSRQKDIAMFKRGLAWLEKQCEKTIPKNIDDAALQYVDTCAVDGEITHDNITEPYWNHHSMMAAYKAGWLKKQGEKSPIDESEPKFKVGDWVQIKGGHVMNILEVKKDVLCYKILNWCGNESVRKISDIDSIAHLWTIEDAKDGDVVVDKSDGTIGIFQSIGHHPDGGSYNDPSYCFLHCRYDDGFFYADFENGNTMDSDDAIPATKEQRELLFQNMKEAGYEWDAEKKELKEIEQKTVWSEEDENHLKNCIAYFRTIEKTSPFYGDYLWLKSLKPNHWKPSEEQMQALIKRTQGLHTNSETRKVLESLIFDLQGKL